MPIKVIPSSSEDCIAGWLGESLKVRVRAPAERGRANAAAEKLVALALGLAPERVRVVRGQTSSRKVLEISGLAEEGVLQRLGSPGASETEA